MTNNSSLADLTNFDDFPEHFLRWRHMSIEAIKRSCKYLHQIDPSERCNFTIHSQCDEYSELIPYHVFMFCQIENPTFVNPKFLAAMFLMFLWMLWIFMFLFTIVDDFFCPSLGVISKLMKLSENLAGVTLLAWGNSVPDIMSSIGSSNDNTLVMFNNLMGGAMFVTAMVAGIIAIVRPFNLQPFPFLRDLVFMLGSIIWIRISTMDEVVTLGEAITYIIIYIFYLIVVIGGYLIQEKVKKYIEIDKASKVNWDELRRRSLGGYEDDLSASSRDVERDEESGTSEIIKRSHCAEFFHAIKPIRSDEWKDMTFIEKVAAVLKSPAMLIFKFFIPVVNPGDYKNGWCRLLNSMQCVFFPTYFVAIAKLYHLKIYDITIFAITGPVGLVIGLIVFFTSEKDKPPRYHNMFSFMCFVGGMTTIYILVDEIVAVLGLFGTLADLKYQTLGLTLLAWGNSIGDAITNISIAKQGFQRMAFAGCFGGPIGNTLLSMGITFVIKNIKAVGWSSPVRGGIMGPNCTTYLMISLGYSIFYVLLTNFEARKSYGIFLILIYIEFLLFTFLAQFRVIHPLGTDHEFDLDLYYEAETNRSSIFYV